MHNKSAGVRARAAQVLAAARARAAALSRSVSGEQGLQAAQGVLSDEATETKGTAGAASPPTAGAALRLQTGLQHRSLTIFRLEPVDDGPAGAGFRREPTAA